MLKIRRDDNVVVLSGKDKGKNGRVLEMIPKDKKGSRVLVQGINLAKRHTRRRREDEKGGIVEKEAPIQISNLALFCPACKRGVRVGIKIEGKKKIRFCRKCQAEL